MKERFSFIKSRDSRNTVIDLPNNLSLIDSYCLLEAIESNLIKSNQKFPLNRVKGISEIRNVSIYAHGIIPMDKKSVDKIKNLATDILNTYIQINNLNNIEYERENFQFILLNNKQ